MSLRAALLSAVVAAFASPSLAQQSGTREEQAACRPDVRKFCSHVDKKTGEDAFKACLQQNFASLSPKCKAALMAHR